MTWRQLQLILGLGLICVSWLVPNHYPPWTSFHRELASGIGALLLVVATWRAHDAAAPSRSARVLLLLAVIPWLQWATGQLHFSSDATAASAYLVFCALAIEVARAAARQGPSTLGTGLALTVCLAGVVSAGLALAQSLGVAELGLWALQIEPGDRAIGNLGQANNLATLLIWSALGAWHLHESGRLSRPVAGGLVLLLGAALGATQSRTAFLMLFGIALSVFILRRRGIRLKTSNTALLLALAWAVLALLAWPELLRSLLVTDDLKTMAQRGAGSYRLTMWAMLLDAAQRAPWGGYGWLQVGEAQFRIAQDHPAVDEVWFHAHDLALDLVLWMGIPAGIAVFALIVGWWLRRLLRLRSWTGAWSVLCVTVFGIHALLELPHHYLYFLIPVGLWIGLAESEEGEVSRALPGASARAVRWLLPVAALGLGGLLVGPYPAVEEEFRRIRFASMGVATPPPAELGRSVGLSGLVAFIQVSDTEPGATNAASIRAQVESVALRYPYPPMLAKWARCLAWSGDVEGARSVYLGIRQMYGSRLYFRQLADLERRAGGDHAGALGRLWFRLKADESHAGAAGR